MQTLTLSIDGMTCGGCAASVKQALEGVTGVKEAEVSLDNHSATVRFDADATERAALVAAVEEAGFDVRA